MAHVEHVKKGPAPSPLFDYQILIAWHLHPPADDGEVCDDCGEVHDPESMVAVTPIVVRASGVVEAVAEVVETVLPSGPAPPRSLTVAFPSKEETLRGQAALN